MLSLEQFAFMLIFAGVLAFYNEQKRAPSIGMIAAVIFMLSFLFMGAGTNDGIVVYSGKNLTTSMTSYLDPATNITTTNSTAVETNVYSAPPGYNETLNTSLFVVGLLAGLYYLFVNMTRIWGARN